MENYEIVRHIEDFKTRITELNIAFDFSKIKSEISVLESQTLNPSFYNDPKNAQKIIRELNEKKYEYDTYIELKELLEELEMYFEMHQEEDLTEEIVSVVQNISKKLETFEMELLLSNEYDSKNAIVEIHPGAGGTESQDWASMLYRMYRRYAERNKFTFEVLDYQDGEEAGIKGVTFIVGGPKAYGLLKSEHGVHRLIRISPFDSNSRRHTSFASVNVTPELDANINVDIKLEDVRVDTYRASGAGGQHVNTTDSAIRLTHIKTGIVVTCQSERSQIQNRERAFAILKSKLYQLELEAQEKKIKSLNNDHLLNSFGSQIRTYTFHPYSLIKDNRTNYEVGNVGAVMDGEIEEFINAYLKSEYNVR